MKFTVSLLSGIPAQAHRIIRQGAEYAPAIFATDRGLPSAVDGMALDGSLEGVYGGGLDGNVHQLPVGVIFRQDAPELLARAVAFPQVRGRGIGQICLLERHVPSATLDHAQPGANGYHPAGQILTDLVAVLFGVEIVLPGGQASGRR